MPSFDADPVQILRSSQLFQGLLEDDYEMLLPGLKVRTYAKDAFLFYEDDEGGSAYLVVSGCVSIERTVDSSRGDAETVQIAVRGPGSLIGELSLISDEPRNADARALEPTTVLQMRGKHVLECSQQSPELAMILMRVLAEKVREATERRTHAQVSNVHDRLLRALREEARLHGVPEPAGVRIPLATPERRLTQGELAARAGCDRAVVNRTLAGLVLEGLVEKDRDSILVRSTPRGQVVAGTLLRAAREYATQAGTLAVPERQLRNAPAALATTPESLDKEIERLVSKGALTRAVARIEVRDEAVLVRAASGERV